MHELTDELMAVVVLAADHGIDSLRRGGPLVPFVLSETAIGARRLQRLAAGRPFDAAASVARARGVAADCARQDAIVALVYGGSATVEGQPCDAVVVESAELGGRPLLFVQPYQPRRRLRPLRTRGNLAFLGEGSPFAAAA